MIKITRGVGIDGASYRPGDIYEGPHENMLIGMNKGIAVETEPEPVLPEPDPEPKAKGKAKHRGRPRKSD